jgi:hypothetical protein
VTKGDFVSGAGQDRRRIGNRDGRRLEDRRDGDQKTEAVDEGNATHPEIVVEPRPVRVLRANEEVGVARVPVDVGVADQANRLTEGPHALGDLVEAVVVRVGRGPCVEVPALPTVAGNPVLEVVADVGDGRAHLVIVAVAVEGEPERVEHRTRARMSAHVVAAGLIPVPAPGAAAARLIVVQHRLVGARLDPIGHRRATVHLRGEERDGRPPHLRGVDRPVVVAVVPAAGVAAVVLDVALRPHEILGGVLHDVPESPTDHVRRGARGRDIFHVAPARDGLEVRAAVVVAVAAVRLEGETVAVDVRRHAAPRRCR